MNQPMQPLAYDEKGVLRFKPNAIVQYILDNGGVDLNKIACLQFSKEDRQQFAQLIGYSLGGYSSLSYADNESCETAEKIFNEGLSDMSNNEAKLGVVLYRPKLHEKGWARFSENSFFHEFDKVFKSEESAIKYAQKWLDFEYSQEFVRIPKDLDISCDEFVLVSA